MKKSLLVIVLLLIVLGGIAYFLMSNKQMQPKTMVETKNQPTSAAMTRGSLLDLLSQGKNLNCTFNTSTNNVESSGTVYVSGKNIRTDFTTTVEGKKNTGSMIRDENYSYVWGMGMAQGIKIKNSSIGTSANSAQNKQYFDQTAKVDYNCQPWGPNNSIFSPPADIKFSELSIPLLPPQVTGSSGSATTGSQAACAACNSLSDQAKAMCLSQLHCQ